MTALSKTLSILWSVRLSTTKPKKRALVAMCRSCERYQSLSWWRRSFICVHNSKSELQTEARRGLGRLLGILLPQCFWIARSSHYTKTLPPEPRTLSQTNGVRVPFDSLTYYTKNTRGCTLLGTPSYVFGRLLGIEPRSRVPQTRVLTVTP